jgi:hypothetical protein
MEVTFGAVLSVALGVALAVAMLVFKPVTTARELPKDPAPDTVYYLEGSHDSAKARQAMAKGKRFAQGGSVELNEDELNAVTALEVRPPQAAKPADKKPAGKKAGEDKADAPPAVPLMTPGVPNFRIRHGVLQVAVPLTFSLLGFEQHLIVQTRGTFVKDGDVFVFDPDETYLGSCPLHRIPPVRRWFLHRIWSTIHVPENLVASWDQLANVAIEGPDLRLTMP